ncbi:glutamate receptor 2-like [Symsagittifera roscoffensis]|uniref:glutamate receptor 2-like n=1 Tax=Symsagittifera roscoffensis TaxID=84072 RepID=UPI00307B4B63
MFVLIILTSLLLSTSSILIKQINKYNGSKNPVSTKGLDLTISTIYDEPFLFEISCLENRTQRIGYIQDLINELQLRMGFEYKYVIVPDGNYGAPIGNDTWNGMVGEVYHGKADMAFADLTINAMRSEVVDFTVPFMRIDYGMIFKKPTVKFGIVAYLMPFSKKVWFTILGSLILVSITLYFFGLFCSSSNNQLENIGCCFYFSFACLFAQGPETYPKSLASRTATVSWWFFSLAILTIYTSSLTSMRTVNRATLPLRTIEDLLDYPDFHFAIEPGQAAELTFQTSTYEPFQRMYQDMISRDTGFYLMQEGMDRARSRNDFAFIVESPYIEYELTIAPCDLEVIFSTTSPKTGVGYGIAFPKGSPLTEVFSTKILELIEDGTIATIHRRWFVTRSQCSEKKKFAENVEVIVFKDIQGLFFTFGIGIVVAFVIFLVASVFKVAKTKYNMQNCKNRQLNY